MPHLGPRSSSRRQGCSLAAAALALPSSPPGPAPPSQAPPPPPVRPAERRRCRCHQRQYTCYRFAKAMQTATASALGGDSGPDRCSCRPRPNWCSVSFSRQTTPRRCHRQSHTPVRWRGTDLLGSGVPASQLRAALPRSRLSSGRRSVSATVAPSCAAVRPASPTPAPSSTHRLPVGALPVPDVRRRSTSRTILQHVCLQYAQAAGRPACTRGYHGSRLHRNWNAYATAPASSPCGSAAKYAASTSALSQAQAPTPIALPAPPPPGCANPVNQPRAVAQGVVCKLLSDDSTLRRQQCDCRARSQNKQHPALARCCTVMSPRPPARRSVRRSAACTCARSSTSRRAATASPSSHLRVSPWQSTLCMGAGVKGAAANLDVARISVSTLLGAFHSSLGHAVDKPEANCAISGVAGSVMALVAIQMKLTPRAGSAWRIDESCRNVSSQQ